MQHNTTLVQLLWHFVGAINAACEVIAKLKTKDYPGAIQYAIKGAGHISALRANRETLQTAGETLLKQIKQLKSRLHYPWQRKKKTTDRHDDAE